MLFQMCFGLPLETAIGIVLESQKMIVKNFLLWVLKILFVLVI